MKISVITVVYNDLPGLKKTVESVLGQSTSDFEYIIIDGASTDGCKEYIESLTGVSKIVSEKDSGIYNAMNKAVAMADGEFCIFMNAGDTFYDATVMEKANAQLGEADLYVGHTVEIGEEKTQRFEAPAEMTIAHLLKTSIYHQSTFTRTALLKHSPYREDLKIVSDWAFFFEQWLRGAEYQPLNFFVSNYFWGGYSAQNVEKIDAERKCVIDKLLPPRLMLALQAQNKDYCQRSRIEEKIEKCMSRKPLLRDVLLIRYGLKSLIKDLFKL